MAAPSTFANRAARRVAAPFEFAQPGPKLVLDGDPNGLGGANTTSPSQIRRHLDRVLSGVGRLMAAMSAGVVNRLSVALRIGDNLWPWPRPDEPTCSLRTASRLTTTRVRTDQGWAM